MTPERDAKLQKLKELIQEKAHANELYPDGLPRRKLLVFSSSAETAHYLYENLHKWATQTLGIHSALVTGGNKPNASTFGQSDYESILTNFSPRSKRGQSTPPQNPPQKTKSNRNKASATPATPHTPSQEIDLLFATDCISEGQNLQDCDTVVNYDIHWNPVRLVQRFGRIDRLKSTNTHIQMVNFWPTPDLNRYINLQGRVEARMLLADLSASAADNILNEDHTRQAASDEISYRDQQLLRLQQETLDLEDLNQDSPNLADFSLEDFRRELLLFLEANRKKLQALPLGLYAVVPAPKDHPIIATGAIFCLKQKNLTESTKKNQPNERQQHNPLSPYFLVYVRDNGKLCFNYTSVKHTLDLFRDLCIDETKAHTTLCDLFQKNTDQGKKMSHYNHLITQAVREIVGKVQEINLNALFQKGGKLAKQDDLPKDLENFELITWLVLL